MTIPEASDNVRLREAEATSPAWIESAILHLEQVRALGIRYLPVRPVESAPGIPSAAADAAAPAPAPRSPPQPRDQTRPVAPVSADPAPLPVLPPALTVSLGPTPATAAGAEPAGAGAASSEPDPGVKEAAMEALRARVTPCVQCTHLAAARRQVVFGVGNIHSPLLFVGEAPGADEDLQGEPFVGKAGQLLTRIIQTMGFAREAVYIANILKCRPDTPRQASGNRKPTLQEMQTCLPYLLAQIEIIKPKVIVALGATAVEGLFGKTEGITRIRGRWLTFQGIDVMPTYHPAYLLRNQAMAEKRKVWEDMLQVMERLALPISDRQRHYFSAGS
jgi:DNA polymerase